MMMNDRIKFSIHSSCLFIVRVQSRSFVCMGTLQLGQMSAVGRAKIIVLPESAIGDKQLAVDEVKILKFPVQPNR